MAVFTGNGSAASPSITFSGDTNTGIFTGSADNTVRIANNGQEHVRITAAGDLQVFETNGNPTTGNLIQLDASEGDVRMVSQNGGPLAGLRNQIINGDTLIWQRGSSGWYAGAGTGYSSVDRFGTTNGQGFNRSTVVPVEGGFTYSAQTWISPGTTGSVGIRQVVELPAAGDPGVFQVGTTWTVSLYADAAPSSNQIQVAFVDSVSGAGSVSVATVTLSAIQGPDANGFTRYGGTFTVNASPAGTNLGLRVYWVLNGRFTGLQLEPGPVATPFEHRPIGTELALCQRYFWYPDYSPYSGSSVANVVFYSTPVVGTARLIEITFPTEMRVGPSVAVQALSNTFPTRGATTGYFLTDGNGRAYSWAGDVWAQWFHGCKVLVSPRSGIGSNSATGAGSLSSTDRVRAENIAFDAEL